MRSTGAPKEPRREPRTAGEPYAVRQVRESAQALLAEGKVEEAFEFCVSALEAVLRKTAELELLLAKMQKQRLGTRSERLDPAQLQMLSVDDRDGRRTARMALLYAVALLPVSLLPTVLGVTGSVYFWGALALGIVYAGAGALMLLDANRRAWWVFMTSIVYLPALLTLAVLDKVRVS